MSLLHLVFDVILFQIALWLHIFQFGFDTFFELLGYGF